jgi:pimeloyl-ACP methyl ester carboxylesterase
MPIAHVNGADIYYEIKGNGAPLLLLPGLGRGTSYFDAIEPALRAEFQTIVVDPRGIDRSSKAEGVLTAELWADDFAALLAALGMHNAHVLGSSHGGSMAMAMALRHPGSVRSLILFGAFSELDRFIALNMDLRIRLAKKIGMGEDMRDFIALWTFGHEGLDDPNAEKFLAAQLAAVKEHTPESYATTCKSLLHWGRKLPGQDHEPLVTSMLENIKCPTLVVCGTKDFWIPPKFSRIIADRIPGAQYVEMPHCGHIAVREDPARSSRLVRDFVGSLPANA